MLFPVPWAREPSISHLVTAEAMRSAAERRRLPHRLGPGFDRGGPALVRGDGGAHRSSGMPAVTFQAFLGNDFPAMARNQVANLRDRRIRTVTYVCEA